jgi:hypothetical protein
MRRFFSTLVALVVLGIPSAASAQTTAAITEDFTEEQVGAAPTSFSTPTGWWSIGTDGVDTKPVLFEDGTHYAAANNTSSLGAQAQAQAQGQNVHQFADANLDYYALALSNKAPAFTQGTITAEFAIVGGDLDTDSGIVFNYQPDGSYLALREDADEAELILFSVSQGQQSNLSIIQNVPASLAQWHRLQLTVQPGGTHLTGSFDEARLLDVDLTAPISGQVGTIAKTDTVVMFNSFTVDPTAQ